MMQPYAGYLLRFEPRRTAIIGSDLQSVGAVAESFSTLDSQFEPREVVFLSLTPGQPSISAAGLRERMQGTGGTGKLKMRITDPIFIKPEITSNDLPTVTNFNNLTSTPERLRRIDSVLWHNILNRVYALRPQIKEPLEKLLAKREEERRLIGEGDRIQRLFEERDAIGLTFDIVGLDRRKPLRNLRTGQPDKADSVLDLLDGEPLQEQDIIRRDQENLEHRLGGTRRSNQFKGPSSQVRVHVYDKKPVETVLGIDLLIYQAFYKSYLLIQYKTMQQVQRKYSNDWRCRIDRQMIGQIEVMDKTQDATRELNGTFPAMNQWRMNACPFYFKFCKTTGPADRDYSLTQGMTLSLPHLKDFLSLDDSRGLPTIFSPLPPNVANTLCRFFPPAQQRIPLALISLPNSADSTLCRSPAQSPTRAVLSPSSLPSWCCRYSQSYFSPWMSPG